LNESTPVKHKNQFHSRVRAIIKCKTALKRFLLKRFKKVDYKVFLANKLSF